jgi:uncharacterized protein YcfL
MKHHRHPLSLVVLTAAFLAGCQTTPGPYEPLDTTKYTIENTNKFVLLDQSAQVSVTCTGLQERILPDGRLEVVANVKNRENRRLQVQINCVFKDEQGFSTGDETPFRTLTLAENSTEAVKFTSMNNLARKYTIRVRQSR